MGNEWQIILAGEGGQGLILGGRILAAAGIAEGKNVVQTQTYGIQTRGGHTQAEVIIKEGLIYYPACRRPDLVLTLTQKAYDRFRVKVPFTCFFLYDSGTVKPRSGENQTGYPIAQTVMRLGRPQAVNILALGLILRHLPVVNPVNLEKGLEEELQPKSLSLYREIFRRGLTGKIEA